MRLCDVVVLLWSAFVLHGGFVERWLVEFFFFFFLVAMTGAMMMMMTFPWHPRLSKSRRNNFFPKKKLGHLLRVLPCFPACNAISQFSKRETQQMTGKLAFKSIT